MALICAISRAGGPSLRSVIYVSNQGAAGQIAVGDTDFLEPTVSFVGYKIGFPSPVATRRTMGEDDGEYITNS